MVGRELLGIIAKHVARELVEQDHGRERGQRVGQESDDRKLALLRPQLQELLLDPMVERIVPPELLPVVEAEPEPQHIRSPIVQAAVPPTVRPSMSTCGWPTPAATDWPPLPHTPMPSSSSRSLAMPLTRVSTVGPSPISVAPLIGSPILPPRMR